MVEQAVQAAVTSYEQVMRHMPTYERAAILFKISEGLSKRLDEVVHVLAQEAGKPIRDARVEVDRGIFTFRQAAQEAERIEGEVIPLDLLPSSKGRMAIVRRMPIGPILGISPFNFPLNLAVHKLAPAIAAGNSIVLKLASADPLTMLLVAEIIAEAGIPPGAVSILPMDSSIANDLVSDDRFKLVTFTGSMTVGWALKARAGKKRVVLELGGNAGVIVDKGADLPFAVQRITIGSFAFAGQTCISVQRVYVHDSHYDEFYAFKELEVGGVIVNDIPSYRIDHMPYGGTKDSGLGREGLKYAIEDMTELRMMALNGVL
jgi:glyceraldehyde-3-phosphate dehydrogenase (NADP+)